MHKFITLRYDGCFFTLQNMRDCFPYYGIFFANEYYPISIRKSDNVLDLGAHIGFFTVYAAKKARKVVAVEPLPRNFSMLRMNVMRNHLKNVILINKAISDKSGYGYLTQEFLTSHLSDSGILCQTVTVDELLDELGMEPDVVKIDIEGAEVYCMNSKSITKAREICVESHGTSDLIEQWLKRHNYSCSRYRYNPISITKSVMSHLPDFIEAEVKTKFLASKLWLRYALGLMPNPIAPCDPSGIIQMIYGKRHVC